MDCAEEWHGPVEECDHDVETKIVSSKKWRKKKHTFEELAHEWRQQHDDDAEFVSDSSDEDDESHM